MIVQRQGDMLSESNARVLVNPVNCVGVMGKGLALEFKKKRAWHYPIYKNMCNKMNRRPLQVGYPRLLHSDNLLDQSIICFPTKFHWENPSELSWIKSGLTYMVEMRPIWWNQNTHVTIATPLLGAGLGGLDKMLVKSLIENILGKMLNTDIEIWTL